MARLSFRCAPEMVERVDRVRGGMPREAWLREAVEGVLWHQGEGKPVGQAVERALSEAKEPLTKEQANPGVRTPGEGRSAASAEQPLSRSEMFRRATKKN